MTRRGRRKPVVPVGDPNDPRGFEVLLGRFLEWAGMRGYTESTRSHLSDDLRLFARWSIERGMLRPVEVSRSLVERYQRWLYHYRQTTGKPLSFRTQRSRLSAVQGFFRWLTRARYVQYNPTSELELPRVEKRLPVDVLTSAEAEAVLRQPKVTTLLGLRDRAILETFYSTGIRRSELIRLEIYDVRLDRGWLTIRQGKGRKDRVVPIGERALAWVVRYVEEVRPELVVRLEEQAVFLTAQGEAFTPHRMTQMVRRAIRASGVRTRGSCHLFRHTAATLMLENGADIRFIQQLLGHSSLTTTEIYTQVSIHQLQKVHAATHPARAERMSSVAGELDGESSPPEIE